MSADASDEPKPAPPDGDPANDGNGDDEKEGFTFTDPGCRTEIRLGNLLILTSIFL